VIASTTPDLPRSCALASRGAGESPIGWSIVGRRFLLVEVPLPWPFEIETAAALPPGLDRILANRPVGSALAFEAIAPEPDWTVPGRTRVILYGPAPEAEGRLGRSEHVVPPGEVSDLVDAWLGGDVAPELSAGERDVVVCTHGAHDPCCGRFGAPAFLELRDRASQTRRVWRGSHTGGHRFAPTFLDLPDGRSWGRLAPGHAERIVTRQGDPATLRGQYRGFGLLASYYERLVEAELLFRHGWGWLDRELTGRVVSGTPFIYPEEPEELDDHAVVEIDTTSMDGSTERWLARIERGGDIETRGECGEEPWDSPTFSVTELRRLTPSAS
jgi:hypothetical protein